MQSYREKIPKTQPIIKEGEEVGRGKVILDSLNEAMENLSETIRVIESFERRNKGLCDYPFDFVQRSRTIASLSRILLRWVEKVCK